MLTQLSRDESFEVFVFQRLRELKGVVLCEGVTEKLVVKKLVTKLGIELGPEVGLIECGGIPHIHNYVSIIALLTSIAKRIRVLGVVVDGEDMQPDQRVESIVNAIRARGTDVDGVAQVSSQLYRIEVSGPRSLEIYVAINGVYSYPFNKHTIHDHGLLLALKMGTLSPDTVERAKVAEEVIDRDTLLELVDEASTEYLRECFEHIVGLLSILASKARDKAHSLSSH